MLIRIMQTYTVHHMMPTDGQAFLNEWKGQQIDGVQNLYTQKVTF